MKEMKLTACYLLFLSVVTFEPIGSYVSPATRSPNYAEEVPSTHKPRILSNATTVSVFEGQSVTFQCTVDELGEFVIIWRKNTDVYFADTVRVKKDPRFTLTEDKSISIKNVHFNDAGNYICQISTTETMELHHTLVVRRAPAVKTNPDSGMLTVKLGEPIRIGCDTSSYPRSKITWTHSMVEISDFAQEGNIVIPVSEKKHAGVYECKVDNGTDVPSLGKIEVKVHYMPRIETPTKLIYTGEGASAEISCTIHGEPVPQVIWLKDDGKIIFSKEHRHSTAGHTHTLQIRKVSRSDLGNYTCKAINSLGSASETIEITGVPAPVEFKNGVNDIKSDSYAMMWSVRSHSPVNEFKLKFRKRTNGEEYEWTEVIIPAEKHPGLVKTQSYEITGLEPASVYEATILTRNEFGWNNRSETFVFITEGGVITENTREEPVIEPSEAHESMVQSSDVTSSSIAETQTNKDDAGGNLRCTSILVVIAAFIVAVFL